MIKLQRGQINSVSNPSFLSNKLKNKKKKPEEGRSEVKAEGDSYVEN